MLSAIISNEFDIRKIEVLSIKSYDSNNKCNSIKVMSLSYEALRDRGKGWIILDELVDTGNTLNYIENMMPEALFFSVYIKELSFSYLKAYIKAFK